MRTAISRGLKPFHPTSKNCEAAAGRTHPSPSSRGAPAKVSGFGGGFHLRYLVAGAAGSSLAGNAGSWGLDARQPRCQYHPGIRQGSFGCRPDSWRGDLRRQQATPPVGRAGLDPAAHGLRRKAWRRRLDMPGRLAIAMSAALGASRDSPERLHLKKPVPPPFLIFPSSSFILHSAFCILHSSSPHPRLDTAAAPIAPSRHTI